MVGFIAEPTPTTTIVKEEEYNNQASKLKNLKDSIEPFDSKFSDLSFDDSFIDFDSIRDFFQGSPDLHSVSLDKIDFGGIEKCIMELGDKDCSIETNPVVVDGFNPSIDEPKPIEVQSGDCVMAVKEVKVEFEREINLGSFIEEEISKICLFGGSTADCGDEIVVKSEILDDVVEMRRESFVSASSSVVPDESVARSGVAGDERDIGNASLETGSSSLIGAGSCVNNVVMGDEDESGSDSQSVSESSSSTTSSSSGGDDDQEEEDDEESDEEEAEKEEVRVQLKREVEEGEIEEGEITEVKGEGEVCKSDEEEEEDKMVEWSDVEFDEEEGETASMKGPIRSQNELKVLPPVPPVDVTLQPDHQMLPVGIVLSIMSAQVIVEGVEKHNPLNEGSILWMTEKRSPLGLVDEIFGPVQNPYYVVRYNSESEVPSGINQGTLISFVPEFASHVLNEKNLYKKGYDASGENDEELSDEAEFSDDEKEAEYMRKKKISKRGINGQTVGNKKNRRAKDKNMNVNRKNVGPGGQLPPNQNQQNISSAVASTCNYLSSSNFPAGAGFFQPFSAMAPTSGIFQPSNGAWVNGLPSQQPHNAVIPGGFPANNMPWPAQNQIPHPCQMPISNGMPFQQQFNPSQGSVPNGVPPGGQMSFFHGPSPWPAVIGQNCFNQAPFGMGFQVQPSQPTMNVGDQGLISNGLGMQQNYNLQPSAVILGNIQAPQQFNSGASSGRGKRQFHHGGGRFSGGRGGRGWKAS